MIPNETNNTGDCLEPINSSCSQISSPRAVYVSLYAFTAAVVIFTVFGNLLVIIAVCHFKQLHTPTNVLIVSLAISDCLVGLLVIPAHSVLLIESCLLFVSSFCSLYNVICTHLTFVSIYNIVFIAFDRYFALSNPFHYSNKVSLSITIIYTVVVWNVSLFYNCVFLYFNGNFQSKFRDKCLLFGNQAWFIVDLVVFILPCAVIIILYLKVFLIARRHAIQIRAAFKDTKQLDVQNKGDSMRLERKAAKVLGILVSVFLICLIPYFICSFLIDGLAQPDRVVNGTLTLFFLNSTINPAIYALFYPWFQKSIKLIVTFGICRTDSSLINLL